MSREQDSIASIRWFGGTPNGWAVERLKRVTASITSGVSVNASDSPAEEHQQGVLKTSAVGGGKFFPEENKTVWESEVDRLTCPVTGDSVIMSRMNTPVLVGESGYVPESIPNLFLPDRLWKLSFDKERVFTPFLARVLSSSGARQALSCMATGTSPSMKNLSMDEMGSLPIPLPPIAEQKAIASYLQREIARIDGLISGKVHMLALLEEKRHSLVHKAIEHPQTKIIRIQHVAELINRAIPRLDDEIYIPIGLFNRGRGIFHKKPTLGCDLGDSDFFFIKHDDLIISGQFAWEGAVAVAKDSEEGLVVSHRYHVFKGHEGYLNTTYFWAYLTTQWGDLILNDHSRGAAGRNRPLNSASLVKEKIPVPPYELQQEIAEHVAREQLLKNVIEESKALLNERRAALITAAVTGQIPLEEMQP